MKKFLMLVILVLLIGGGYYYYTNYYTKPAPTPSPASPTPTTSNPEVKPTATVPAVLTDSGYVVDISLPKYTFKSNATGNTFTLSDEALKAIYGQEITGYVMPISPLNENAVILTTAEESKDAAGGFKNHVWQYNMQTGKIFEWYWENLGSNVKNILRSVGTYGTNVLIVATDADYEPATCGNVWWDYARDMQKLDLNDVKAGLSLYMVPDEKTDAVHEDIVKCLEARAANPSGR